MDRVSLQSQSGVKWRAGFHAFAKLKALLRKAAERTVDGLWAAIGRLIDHFPPAECRNYFNAAAYDAA